MTKNIINARIQRQFVFENLLIKEWSDIAPFFVDLETRKINSIVDLEDWMLNKSELEAILEEELAWRYIKTNCNTEDKELSENFNYFISNIEPEISKYANILDKKLYNSEYFNDLNANDYFVFKRELKKNIEIFREENISIISEIQQEEQEYGVISSKMMINYEGEEITLQKASNYLKSTNRETRENVYKLITQRKLKEEDKFNNLLSKLIEKRHKVARNTGYNNFTDYKYIQMGRFDYSQKDCSDFHNSIANEVLPIISEIQQNRKEKLGYEILRPWDLEVDESLQEPLKPFETSNELVDKSIQCFSNINSDYGDYLHTMKELGYLDLDARKGKAPGGFNYPLYESNVPFIYMNATGNLRDLETLMHEGGHAIHSFLSKDLKLVDFKDIPSEVAELASMSMELISMDNWHIFFEKKEDLIRAKKSQLEGVLKVLPWIAKVDKFQHWLYNNPTHTHEERKNQWIEISNQFSTNQIDYTGFEKTFATSWQTQLHIFEVPFYYVEYGFAQLGAIAIWKNHKTDPKKTLMQYNKALSLGYTKTIPEIYKIAGIEFNFSKEYVKELMTFVKQELELLN